MGREGLNKNRKVQFQILFYLIFFPDLFLILDEKDVAGSADDKIHHKTGQDQIKIPLQQNKKLNLGKYFMHLHLWWTVLRKHLTALDAY